MSTFTVPVVRIRNIVPIENADSIEVAEVLGYRCVVKKGQFNVGQLAIYIPESAIVPNDIISDMGLNGKLAGSEKNRVKATKLRGVVSQGLLLSKHDITPNLIEGEDLKIALNITKYEPPIPTQMAGEVCNAFGYTVKFDIENIQRYPNILIEGEEIIMTEKLHGSFCALAIDPSLKHDELLNTNMFAYSKGLGSDGLVFKNNEKNKNNIYHKTLINNENLLTKAREIFGYNLPIHVFGEIFGDVQDLKYGVKGTEFRIFAIYIGRPNQGRYLNFNELENFIKMTESTLVPIIYRGPYYSADLPNHRDGNTLINNITQIREGVVIIPLNERLNPAIGRVILKAVSPAYLLRKGSNTTEYQ